VENECRTSRAAFDRDAIEWLTDRSLDALRREESIDPHALTLLLRRYAGTARADIADALGLGLARALDDSRRAPPERTAEWLSVFIEASAMSDDERVRQAAADLVSTLRAQWSDTRPVEQLARSVDARLVARDLVDPSVIVPEAIDQLETVIAGVYRPGAGIAESLGRPDAGRGRLVDQVCTASALLTAFVATGRLPYAMLAEELMQFARRALLAEDDGLFFDRPLVDDREAARTKPFAVNCEAARLFCRLAELHDAKAYSEAAVLAPGADYRRDATRTLASLESSYREHGAAGAIYALALTECLMG